MGMYQASSGLLFGFVTEWDRVYTSVCLRDEPTEEDHAYDRQIQTTYGTERLLQRKSRPGPDSELVEFTPESLAPVLLGRATPEVAKAVQDEREQAS